MPQAISVERGDVIDYTPSSDVPAGSIVVLNNLIGVTTRKILANELGALEIMVVVQVAKPTGIAFAFGEPAFWDAADEEANADDTNPFMGKVVKAASTTDTVLSVLLCPSYFELPA